MTVETLIKAVPPPLQAAFAFDGPWEPIEGEIRTALPRDYKDAARLYGCGFFIDVFEVFMPRAANFDSTLLPQVYQAQRLFVEHHPKIPMYPQPGGLLACGSTFDGDYVFWLTRGPPDEWPIVLWDRHSGEGEELEMFECDLTDFIAGCITGDIRPRAFGEEFTGADGSPGFVPWPEPDRYPE